MPKNISFFAEIRTQTSEKENIKQFGRDGEYVRIATKFNYF